MQYRFYLDGNLVNEQPLGWDEMIVRVVRSTELKSVLVNLDATLTFTADGYDYIKGIYDTVDYCQEIAISIHRSTDNGSSFIEKYKGLLKLSDMSFDDFNCSVEVKVTDDSYYGRIDARKNTKCYLTGKSTINGEPLTACSINYVRFFDPTTGGWVPLIQSRGAYKVYDVLRYLISYMSDNEIEFESPLFGPGGDFPYLFLTFGYSIRQTGNGIDLTDAELVEFSPQISFQELFTELNKRFNIGLFFDFSGAKPKIIIDYWKELYRANHVTTFPDLPNLKTEIAKELIYSSIKFGGTKTLDIPAASFPETIRFIGFNSEEYAALGKCNVDNTLDLSYDYISASNVIEQILILSGTDKSYDKDWFLIDGESGGVGVINSKQSNWLSGGPPYFYNERLTNYSIAKRYLGFIPDAIGSYLGNPDNSVFAKHTLAYDIIGAWGHLRFNTDSPLPYHDVNGNWDTATNIYTVPLTGVYSVRVKFTYQTHYPIDLHVKIERRDALDVTTLDEVTLYRNFSVGADQPLPLNVSALINASANDLLKIRIEQTGNFNFYGSHIYPDAELTIIDIADGGGIYQTYDPADYPIIKKIFSTEIFESQVDDIVQNPLSLIDFYILSTDSKSGFVDDISIDEFKGTINAKLITSRNGLGEEFPPELRQVRISSGFPDVPVTFDIADHYGNPASLVATTAKTFFFEVGKVITLTIPASISGHNAGNPAGVTIGITETHEFGPVTYNLVSLPDLTVTFTIQAGTDYEVLLGYDLDTVGDTYPHIYPQVLAPASVGLNGSALMVPFAPDVIGNFTFLWSTGATTSGITAPAGDYTCQVTYVPGTYTNNVVTFNIQIPISETGE